MKCGEDFPEAFFIFQKISAVVDKKRPQANLLELLEAKHRQEEALLFRLLEAAPKAEKAQVLAGQSRLELEGSLQRLRQRYDQLAAAQKSERHTCLAEAAVTRLTWQPEEPESAKVALLAQLHCLQHEEGHRLVTGITDWVRVRKVTCVRA